MIDIKFLRENPELVKENIKKKFQDQKLVLVDEVLELDVKNREAKLNGDNLRAERKSLSSQIGELMKAGKKEEAENIKKQVQEVNNKLEENEKLENQYSEEIKNKMMKIPNIMHSSVPIGKDDSENVEIRRWGEPKNFDFEIKAHWDIGKDLNILDPETAAKVTGARFHF